MEERIAMVVCSSFRIHFRKQQCQSSSSRKENSYTPLILSVDRRKVSWCRGSVNVKGRSSLHPSVRGVHSWIRASETRPFGLRKSGSSSRLPCEKKISIYSHCRPYCRDPKCNKHSHTQQSVCTASRTQGSETSEFDRTSERQKESKYNIMVKQTSC